MDWLDLLAVQGTPKSLFQHYSSKASILLSSAFFIVQLSHPYMTTGKTIALTIWTFVGKMMSLLFNMLSRFVIAFLLRNFMATVTVHSDFEAQENKVCHCFHCFPICLLWSDGTRCQDLRFWKAGLKLNIQKTKIMASGPITSWQIDGETMETVRDFILGGGAPKLLRPWN